MPPTLRSTVRGHQAAVGGDDRGRELDRDADEAAALDLQRPRRAGAGAAGRRGRRRACPRRWAAPRRVRHDIIALHQRSSPGSASGAVDRAEVDVVEADRRDARGQPPAAVEHDVDRLVAIQQDIHARVIGRGARELAACRRVSLRTRARSLSVRPRPARPCPACSSPPSSAPTSAAPTRPRSRSARRSRRARRGGVPLRLHARAC